MISFLPTQCMIFSIRFVVQSAKDFHPCKPIQKVATSHAKQKRQGFPLYRLMFIFCQRRRHDCCRTFSLLKSVHGIISPVSNLLAAASNEKQSGRASTIPLDVYLFPTQTARLPHDVFSARICALNRSASVKPIREATASTKSKAVQFSPIPLDVYFLPTQTARLPHGVFSTRICASNRSASVKPIRKAATFTKSKAVQFSPIPLDVYLFPTQTARLPHGVFSARICASNRSANAN